MRAFLHHLCTDYKTHCPLGYFILKGSLAAPHKYTEFQRRLATRLLFPNCLSANVSKITSFDVEQGELECESIVAAHLHECKSRMS